MIACLLIPGFELRAALRKQPGLALRPAALSPVPGREPVLGPVTAEAERLGIRPGMRLGEGLATCPELVLVEQDPAAAEQAWEDILRALEDTGFAVDPAGVGCVYFETRGVERLYGGLEPALRRALTAVGTAWDPRAGAAQRRFAALAAANVARPGQILVVSDERLSDFLAPLPLELVPMEPRRRAELHELGVKRVGQLAGLPGSAVAERLGPDGRRAWSLARGGRSTRVHGRRPPAEIVEALEFPEAIGNELTLRRAFGALVETLMARPERAGRFVRKLALSARLVGGGSWRRSATLRDPTTELDRIKAALGPKLADLPAPVVELRLELVELTEHDGEQLELLPAAGGELDVRLREGLRQVRASTGSGSVNQVVEVAPWSRIPEARALFVPRDD
ncbi:MAG: protein ImuB [Gaiellaceae bacterium]|jgi:nucleotidyltransferase/DNA polymerase involved in DNA repair|nr:protein ImuB [Gaiellaceae bacterium]MDX6387204.1 protein ImuB [Gaiellaceae bacterium]